jgi:serine/threonine protein kinase/Tol biopolymer transport system component
MTMALTAGSRLSSYEIISALGAGGMGEVYRARDMKLNRDVAIKVLLPAVANDPDRLARFSREAQVLASLNHPNIAHIHGLEESNGVTALVMELVEGEDLSQRISRGAIPLDEALSIARQIAEALEAAHDHGIIHRDLKPANIKVRPDGTVKVLDFGLAKAIDPTAGSSATAMNSPTLSIHATQAGIILGTAAYMSPEQATGTTVDKRSDLWAFGIVLMEMLTGRQVFVGESVSHVIAAVLKDEPNWSALPPATPESIRRLLRRCLVKDRRRRLPDAAVARLEIDDALQPSPADSTVSNSRSRVGLAAIVASFIVGGIVIGGGAWVLTRSDVPSSFPAVVRFGFHDTDQVIVSRVQGDMALSPDGRTLAFIGFGKNGSRLWVHDTGSLQTRELPGTGSAFGVAWSPDGKSLAFHSGGQLKKVTAVGGSPETIGTAGGSIIVSGGLSGGGRSIQWGLDGTILSSDSRGFWRADAAGGAPVTLLMRSAQEFHDATGFLPDGRHYLLSVQSADTTKAGTFVVAIDGSTRTRVLPFAGGAQYALGHLLYVRDRVLYAQPFDPAATRLSGDPIALAEPAASIFSVASNGALAYLPLDASDRPNAAELTWMDRGGRLIERVDQAAGGGSPSLSPDGGRLAMVLRGDIWILEMARGVLSKVSRGGANIPTWSADSSRLFFHKSAYRDQKDAIFTMRPGSPDTETLLVEPASGEGDHAHAIDASADGQYLAFEGGGGSDIWVKRLGGDGAAKPVIQGPSAETQPMFSPDGRWLSYTSNASGRFEVYVQRFPEGTDRTQVSPGGGGSARWRRDGNELFYLALDGTLMAVPIMRAAQSMEFRAPVPLFTFFSSQRGPPTQKPQYDVSADGQRFIVSAVSRRHDPSIQVVLNWPTLLEKTP